MAETKDKGPGTKEASEQSFQVTAPSISLPKGGGAIRGMGEKFAANPVTGTGSMTVPIATSPGRSSFGPQLALSYDSGAGNGPFGFGWSLSLPSITRKTDKGLPKYLDGQGQASDGDVFILSGAEDLVPEYEKHAAGNWVMQGGQHVVFDKPRTVNGLTYRIRRYRPRIEGLFARIERWSNQADPTDVFWRSISKDNITTWYGKDENSRICDPHDKTRIFSWLICETYDDKGNVLVYGYKTEDPTNIDISQAHERNRTGQSRSAQRYLKRIRYGNRKPYLPELKESESWPEPPGVSGEDSSEHWLFEVVLDYDEPHYREETPDEEGQIHATASPHVPQNARWPVRNDPFSAYRAGFEVRTYRLCQRVLMFHHFPGEAGVGADCLVRSTDFTYEYEQDRTNARVPIYSFLQSVTQSGYVRQGDRYLKKSLPPVEFTYSKPEVQDRIEEVDPESMENLPVGLDGTAYQWTDLHGEGIPGILTEQEGAWFYKRNWSPIPVRQPDGSEVVKAKFSALETVALKPNVALSSGAQFMDLAGDGQPDLVMLDGPMTGLYEHDEAEGWGPFRPFTSRLNRDMRDPNLRFVDLDGDGHADVLITEDEALVWHASLAEEGFGEARRVAQALDEEKGPRLVFNDGTQSIYLADLSGDGLTDLVRIRNGEVCYWPNLGYGNFGAKVTMDHAPWFDNPDQFDHKRIRLADIDGSGTTDIMYLHRDGVRLYFNQSGNSWSQPRIVDVFPRIDEVASIVPTDLLGNGTACLVWSSPLPGDARRPMRYVNLMGGQKPHLLRKTRNNLGAETVVEYAPSIKFYLQDNRDGKPWITKLPFPVHVVERVETYDHISKNRFITRYAYHHGYFDGEEREFRGFGMVEQWDTEEFAVLTANATLSADNIDKASHVPPVHTKTWFHTGAYVSRDHVSDFYAGLLDATDQGEYFREPRLNDDQARELLLPDTVLPDGLTLDEEREACRALKGSMLRQEVYADDKSDKAKYPYTVTEQNYTIRPLQRRGDNRHAVFFAHANEALSYHYERNPADPRIQHALTLEVDDYGNVLKQAAIGYGRRRQIRVVDAQGNVQVVSNPGLAALDATDQAKQTTALLTYSENRVTNAVELPDVHRTPLPCESVTYELTGYRPTGAAGRYQASDIVEPDPDPAAPGRLHHKVTDQVAYEAAATGNPCRRPIEWLRTLYRRDDLNGLLPLRELHALALPGESYKLACTPGLLNTVFQRPGQRQAAEPLLPDPAAVLGGQAGDQGGYVNLDGDGNWWIPSGRSFFTDNPDHDAATEFNQAWQHFFLPRRYRDPFGHDAIVDFDTHDLLVRETRDALGNSMTVNVNDYRVLQPRLVSDPNRNRAEVAFDTLGMVVGTALMGKPQPAPVEGDSLEGFIGEVTPAQRDQFMTEPRKAIPNTRESEATPIVHELLGKATTRIVYDLERFMRLGKPPVAATIARETHVSDVQQNEKGTLQVSFSYSDGFGREIQKKIQAEMGKVPQRDGQGKIIVGQDGQPVMAPNDVAPRWVGSGWTIFNNKGKPVRQFEPFFSDTHKLDLDAKIGVSPVLFYDPAERVVATLHPNHTYEKVRFDPWQQTTWDVNDTVATFDLANRTANALDPAADHDVGGFFQRLPGTDYLPTWYDLRTDSAKALAEWPDRDPQGNAMPGNAKRRATEKTAAERAATHANTPTTAHFDALGRPFLTVVRNRVVCFGHDLDGTEERFATRVELDIEGNQRAVRDERKLPVNHLPTGAVEQRIVMRYAYDMLGNRIHQLSMEAGARWMLNDVAGKPIRAWDSRGHNFTTKYDELRRPVEQTVQGTFSDPDPFKPNSDPRTLGRDIVVDMIEYGEGIANAEDLNLRTRIYRHFDSAGVATNAGLDPSGSSIKAYDFKGNLLRSTRRLVSDYRTIPDWLLDPQLDTESFEGSTRYDALNRPIQSVAPHSSLGRGKFNIIQPVFNEANLLERVDVWLDRATEPGVLLTPASEAPSPVGVANIDYDAKGQRTRIDYKTRDATVIRTTYDYDRKTFRLTHLYTRRGVDPDTANGVAFTDDCDNPNPPPLTIAAPDKPPQGKACGLQNLHYTYDPAGNITHIRDDTQQTIYFKNKIVEPSAEYTYDAIYRLIQATGREHLWQIGGAPIPHSHNDAGRVGLLSVDAAGRFAPNDGQAMGTYIERYVYDAVGNFLQMQHHGTDPVHSGWMRRYTYNETSLIEGGKQSNRLSRTQVGNGVASAPEDYLHDVHGNMTHMPHLHTMDWDFKDQLRHIRQGTMQAYYVYDASGQRTRKVVEKNNGALIEERIYLGGFEVFRRYNGPSTGSGQAVSLERETLHVMDDKQRIALVETKTLDTQHSALSTQHLVRYQFGNHLGSASLELDDQAQIISYEEYAPYGSSTYQAVRSQTETAKRYRYTGKERDEESGLYYHGVRYYAAWISRWTSPDPADLLDGSNLYRFVKDNPTRYRDYLGMAADDDWSMLNDLWDTEKVEVVDPRMPVQPSTTPMTYPEARAHGNKQAADYRNTAGMNQGATVQAGHTAAARHASESGISKDDWDKQKMQQLHSRRGQGVDVTVVDQEGTLRQTTRHRSQEGLIDDAVERSRPKGGKLTPQGQLDAAEEVLWRSENAPVDQRDIETLRNSGSAMPDKGPPVDPATGKVLDPVPKLDAKVNVPVPVPVPSSAGKKGLMQVVEVAAKRGAKFLPAAGTAMGAKAVVDELSEGNYRRAALEAIGASEIPVVSQTADAALLIEDVGWTAKDVLDPEQKAEQWAHENLSFFGF